MNNKKIKSTEKPNGFTLMEMLIVVTIIGILAAIVVPRFLTTSSSAKTQARKAEKQMINSQLELYYFNTGNYPDSVSPEGWSGWEQYFPDGIPSKDPLGNTWSYDKSRGRIE